MTDTFMQTQKYLLSLARSYVPASVDLLSRMMSSLMSDAGRKEEHDGTALLREGVSQHRGVAGSGARVGQPGQGWDLKSTGHQQMGVAPQSVSGGIRQQTQQHSLHSLSTAQQHFTHDKECASQQMHGMQQQQQHQHSRTRGNCAAQEQRQGSGQVSGDEIIPGLPVQGDAISGWKPPDCIQDGVSSRNPVVQATGAHARPVQAIAKPMHAVAVPFDEGRSGGNACLEVQAVPLKYNAGVMRQMKYNEDVMRQMIQKQQQGNEDGHASVEAGAVGKGRMVGMCTGRESSSRVAGISGMSGGVQRQGGNGPGSVGVAQRAHLQTAHMAGAPGSGTASPQLFESGPRTEGNTYVSVSDYMCRPAMPQNSSPPKEMESSAPICVEQHKSKKQKSVENSAQLSCTGDERLMENKEGEGVQEPDPVGWLRKDSEHIGRRIVRLFSLPGAAELTEHCTARIMRWLPKEVSDPFVDAAGQVCALARTSMCGMWFVHAFECGGACVCACTVC